MSGISPDQNDKTPDHERMRELEEALGTLFDCYAELWDDIEEMFDSSTAMPGLSMKGKELWPIAVLLGRVEDEYA